MATARQPPFALRLPVRTPRQEALVHGERVRPIERVEPRFIPGLAPDGKPRARRDLQLDPGPQRALPSRARAARARLRTSWFRAVDGGRRIQLADVHTKRPQPTTRPRGMQFHT